MFIAYWALNVLAFALLIWGFLAPNPLSWSWCGVHIVLPGVLLGGAERYLPRIFNTSRTRDADNS